MTVKERQQHLKLLKKLLQLKEQQLVSAANLKDQKLLPGSEAEEGETAAVAEAAKAAAAAGGRPAAAAANKAAGICCC